MKTAYPTTADLAQFLASTGLFRQVKVTAGAASVTQAVSATAQMRVGDTLYFADNHATRTVDAIPSATSVTVDSTITTTANEAVYLFPAALDLATAAQAGITAFEREAGRKMLATGDTTRRFDKPNNGRGLLDLKADLAGITSLTVDGEAKTLYTDYRPLPEDADEEGLPWNRVQFAARWLRPLVWSDYRAVVIVGRWGMFSSATGMPEEAWTAMLAGGALARLTQIGALRSRGLISWSEADVSENYGETPLKGLAESWKLQFNEVVARYKRRTVG